MDINEMIDMYMEDGLTRELAAARVCQDVVLKAISIGPLNRNVTIKGGVVMRSITNNNRRATAGKYIYRRISVILGAKAFHLRPAR